MTPNQTELSSTQKLSTNWMWMLVFSFTYYINYEELHKYKFKTYS